MKKISYRIYTKTKYRLLKNPPNDLPMHLSDWSPIRLDGVLYFKDKKEARKAINKIKHKKYYDFEIKEVRYGD